MNGSTPPTTRRRPEPAAITWARRLVTVPATLTLASAALLGFPLWVLVAAAGDLAVAAPRLPRTRAVVFFVVFLVAEALALFGALAIWLAFAGGLVGGPLRYLRANQWLVRRWIDAVFLFGVWVYGMRVHVEGLEAGRTGPLLLFVRHTSTADSLLAGALIANPNGLNLRYVIKRELLWDPCFDIVLGRLPNVFIGRSARDRDAAVQAIAGLARGVDERSVVLIYPEGTRFTESKQQRALEKLRAAGRADLAALAATFRHVLPPRLAGPLALIDAAPGVDVAFLEHVGFDGTTTFREFWRGGLVGASLEVRLRRVPAHDIPREGRERWLFEEFAELDRWVDAHLERAGSGDDGTEPRGPA